jgi:hypothetical protein
MKVLFRPNMPIIDLTSFEFDVIIVIRALKTCVLF